MLPAFTKHLHELLVESQLPVPPEAAFAWHERPQVFARLTPPWETVKLLKLPATLGNNETAILQVPLTGRLHPMLPIWKTWVARHHQYQAGVQFTDTQVTGPFAQWTHTHRLLPVTENNADTCLLQDEMRFQLPLAPVADWMGGLTAIRLKLRRMFRYRHEITKLDLERHALAAENGFHHKRFLLVGASGMVGRALAAFLVSGGHTVVRLVRNRTATEEITPEWAGTTALYWNPATQDLPALEALEGFDVCIHLGGANIAKHRWNAQYKRTVWESRVQTTALLATTLAKLTVPPKVFITASGIRALDEEKDNETPTNFLKELTKAWEQATEPAQLAGIRCVQLRIGVVLGLQGSMLQELYLPFLLGGGIVLGQGHHPLHWVSLEDLLGAIYHSCYTPSLSGGITVIAPESVTQQQFTETLNEVLYRPNLGLHLPKTIAEALFGKEFIDTVLLNMAVPLTVQPTQLLSTGFTFAFPTLLPALRFHTGVSSPLESLIALL